MNKFITTRFETLSSWISDTLGNPHAFLIALTIVILWLVTGPLFGFSDTWQLVINTSTTIVTFLMVFLLQNTGNRTIDEMHERLKKLERQNSKMERQNSEMIAELKKLTGSD